MVESGPKHLPIDRVIASLVRVETGGDIDLDAALKRIGFEISTNPYYDKKGILIFVRPILKPNSTAALVLVLRGGGIYHMPEKDGYPENKKAPAGRLEMVSVDDYNKEVVFCFGSCVDSKEYRYVRLRTEYRRENGGSF